ncbi:unnamed protein product [Calypogeia fissa]
MQKAGPIQNLLLYFKVCVRWEELFIMRVVLTPNQYWRLICVESASGTIFCTSFVYCDDLTGLAATYHFASTTAHFPLGVVRRF